MGYALRICRHSVFRSGASGTRIARHQKRRLVLESFTRVHLFRDRRCIIGHSDLSCYSPSICRLTITLQRTAVGVPIPNQDSTVQVLPRRPCPPPPLSRRSLSLVVRRFPAFD